MRPRDSSPWTAEDALRWLTLSAGAVFVCGVAWWWASAATKLVDQVAGANLAVAGLVVSAYANVAWLLRGRRAVGLRRVELLAGTSDTAAFAVREAPPLHGVVVAGDGLDRFHRPECALAAGKGWPASDIETLVASGRRPCGVCRP